MIFKTPSLSKTNVPFEYCTAANEKAGIRAARSIAQNFFTD
jgi:hypothetical protein